MFCGFVVVVERCQKFLLLLSKEPRVDVITSHNSVTSLSLLPGMHFAGIPAVVPKCLRFICVLALGAREGAGKDFLIKNTQCCTTEYKFRVVYKLWVQFSCQGPLLYDHVQMLQVQCSPYAVIIYKIRSSLFWWALSVVLWNRKHQLEQI